MYELQFSNHMWLCQFWGIFAKLYFNGQHYKELFLIKKKKIQFFLKKYQDPVKSPTTEACWIAYYCLSNAWQEQNSCTVVFTGHQSTKRVRSIFWLVFETSKSQKCCSSVYHPKVSLNVEIPSTVYFVITSRIFGQIIWKSIKST